MSELYHHGIKGQRWGVRRYQNMDGSLTSKGRTRYDVGDPKSKSESSRKEQIHKALFETRYIKTKAEKNAAKKRKEAEKNAAKKRREAEGKLSLHDRYDNLSSKQKTAIKVGAAAVAAGVAAYGAYRYSKYAKNKAAINAGEKMISSFLKNNSNMSATGNAVRKGAYTSYVNPKTGRITGALSYVDKATGISGSYRLGDLSDAQWKQLLKEKGFG